MTVILFDHQFDVVVFVSGIVPNALLVKHLEECLSDLLVTAIGVHQHIRPVPRNGRQFLLSLPFADLVDDLALELLEGHHHDLCARQ
jgi:hypothetical protein